jgi:hypothetical protein
LARCIVDDEVSTVADEDNWLFVVTLISTPPEGDFVDDDVAAAGGVDCCRFLFFPLLMGKNTPPATRFGADERPVIVVVISSAGSITRQLPN